MNLATWSIRNPLPTILLFFFLAIAGIFGFNQLSIQNIPDLDFPKVSIALAQPGASPSQLEAEVARKVEDSLATLGEVRTLATNITDGMVLITLEFELSKSLTDALIDVKGAVDRVRNQLPNDLEDPQISKMTIAPGGALATYSITHPNMDAEALSWFVDYEISKRLMGIAGVGAVERKGGVDREIKILLDIEKANGLGVTASEVSRTLYATQNQSSGGLSKLGGMQQGIRTLNIVGGVEELSRLPIALGDNQYVRLDQIAQVIDTHAEPSMIARLNGQPAVAFEVKRSKGYDEIKLAAAVDHALRQLQDTRSNLSIQRVQTSTTNTFDQFSGSMQMLLEGGLLAVLVIGVFLREWRTTLIGAVALPLSVLPTFAVMYWLDFSLNGITLLALAVIVGVLVDDAVVEVENIARHMQQGKSVVAATTDAINEIAIAVLGTTATLIAVFLPTATMSGISGMFFQQFGWTIVAAIFASFLVARMVTPIMAIWILKPNRHHERDSALLRAYLSAVKYCLQHRRLTIACGALFFFASMSMVPLIPTSFIPPEDNGLININYELPAGSPLNQTDRVAENIRSKVQHIAGIADIFTTIGSVSAAVSDTATAGSVRKGSMYLVLSPRQERESQQAIEARVRIALQSVAGARVNIGSSHPGEKLVTILKGDDPDTLIAAANDFERDLRTLPFLTGVSSSAQLERSEIRVTPIPELMIRQGISTLDIGETLRIALSGDFEPALAKLNLENRQVDIRVQLDDGVQRELAAIQQLRIKGNNGLVPLASVADIDLTSGPSQIDRFARQRQITLTADLGGYPIGAAVAARDQLPSLQNLPSGVEIAETGDAQFLKEMVSGFVGALVLGILLIYAIMVLLFKDWAQPMTIVAAIPLSTGGALLGLLLTGHSLGMPAFIGLITLLGIVTKNSILLVDFAALARREHGLNSYDAIIDACHKRARPIVMTTVAMTAGLMPLALGFGGGASLRQPMAVAVIGGLLSSTFLSLLIIPVTYYYVARWTQKPNHAAS